MLSRSPRPRAFTLVELMIVIAIVGVLAALAVLGVRRYLATSKTAEAKMSVGAIAHNAAVQYERERDISEMLLAGGSSAQSTHLLCASAAAPVPANFAQVQGRKYQPTTAPGTDFMAGSAIAGWQCLGFSITNPIYFQYSYQVGGGYVSQGAVGAPIPAGLEAFEAAARGDLDGDGTASVFARTGEVRNGQLVLATQIFIDNELE
ncbi:MAG: type II secretion system protein [Polyangiaceae bacterium]|nr:type II secretion system protein [Polyangiaceae bacterium]